MAHNRIGSWSLGLVVTLAGGCTAIDGGEGLDEGVTLHATDPTAGIAGALVRDGHVIYFETRRGAPLEEHYQVPGQPVRYLIDVRLVDADGLTFYLRQAEDEILDPSWASADSSFADGATRELDWELAAELGVLLPDAGLVRASGELAAFAGLSWSLSPEARALEAEIEVTVDENGAADTVFATTYKHYLTIGYDPDNLCTAGTGLGSVQCDEIKADCSNFGSYPFACCGTGGYLNELYCSKSSCAGTCGMSVCGSHSATRLRVTNAATGAQVSVVDKANHGAGPYDSGMSTACTSSYTGRSNSTTTGNVMCSNSYDKFSRGTYHNCNDDSRYQALNVRYNNSSYSSVCSYSGCNLLRPSCDGAIRYTP